MSRRPKMCRHLSLNMRATAVTHAGFFHPSYSKFTALYSTMLVDSTGWVLYYTSD